MMIPPVEMSLSLDEAIAHLRGMVGRNAFAEAELHCRQLLDQAPSSAELATLLTSIYRQQGRFHKARLAAGRALERMPDSAGLHLELGRVLLALDQVVDGEARLRRAVELDPGCGEAFFHLGRSLRGRGELEAAIEAFRAALAATPDLTEVYGHLGVALNELKRLEESLGVMEEGLRLRPDDAELCRNLALLLAKLGRRDEGLRLCEDFLAGHPEAAAEVGKAQGTMYSHMAMDMLRRGNMEEGWDLYRWRFKTEELCTAAVDVIPEWEGEDLDGKTLLVRPEQGLGDFIQCCRYVPLVATRKGGKALVMPPPLLRRLLQTLDGIQIVDAHGLHVDRQIPVMNLPYAFGTRLDSIPADVPYLHAEPELVAAWRERLGGEGYKVGLVWAGNPGFVRDEVRSCDLSVLAGPLRQVPGVRYYSLQVGQRREQLEEPEGEGIIDLSPHLTDFAETAAAITCLDLVISVDTSVAHLAGALARPVWIMLPEVADWRWLEGREDSPWYPTARLFRQQAGEDGWDGVARRLAEALAR